MICALGGCQTLVNKVYLPKDDLRPSSYKVDESKGVEMITSDGIKLVADIFHPLVADVSSPTSQPTVLARIPFGKGKINEFRAGALGHFFASRGYNVVIQGSRGRYKSAGDFYPLIDERRDGLDTLKWISKQPWHNGQLAMWGGSSFGYTQWAIADQVDLAPKAYSIQIASSEFYKMFYPGGAFSLESALYWSLRG